MSVKMTMSSINQLIRLQIMNIQQMR